MYRLFQFVVIFLLSVSVSNANPPFSISGTVSDKQTGERLMFVNIGIEGTLSGTSSNALGEFTLTIPANLTDKNIYFSAIGYQNRSLPIASLTGKASVEVELESLTYGIEDIEVSTKSRVMYRIVRDASRAVSELFIAQAFSASAIYSSEKFIDQVAENKREALVTISDATGYGNKRDAFKARNYRFDKVKRNFDVENLKQGTTSMDELLTLDLLREPFNVSDTVYLSEYDLDMHRAEELNGDSVWVIAFRHSNPNASRTGNYYVTSYQGRLYISKTHKVLLKAETQIHSEMLSPINPDIAVQAEKAHTNVNLHYTTTYKNTDEGFMPDKFIVDKNYTTEKGERVRTLASLLYLGTETDEPVLMTSRQYYENLMSDPDFWLSFEQ